jgi:hypothetical protein
MLTETQLARLDLDISRILLQIGKREAGNLLLSANEVMELSSALQNLTAIKRANQQGGN